MHTERFRKLRKEALSKIFEKKAVSEVWRKIVRNQLRTLDIKDLYDHYDFNYNIEDRATAIRNEILNGTYRVSLPLIYRIEKKFGVCRHVIVPQPTDALVLQVLVEDVSGQIIAHQPSKNSFYSRDKHNVGKPHDAAEYGISFRDQWKKLQKEIYRFNDEKNLLVVTDLANYYDSISISELQKVFLGYVKTNEVLVDVLFRVIEEISWKPDYLPYTGKGLPTSNLEAIRLLAHSFLFEIDDVLKQRTNNSFTRWMDDIVIGVDDQREAIDIISSISDMLKSRGLALNLSKTAIYDSKQAYYHFQIEENKYLDTLDGLDKNDPHYEQKNTELEEKFKNHFKDQIPKYWEKITKRYITAFGKLQSLKLLDEIPNIYLNHPGLRTNLLFYLSSIGYGRFTADKMKTILDKIDIFDDISLYQICFLVTSWEIPINDESKEFLKYIDDRIVSASFKNKNPSDFYSVLWFKSKYSHPEELLNFVKKYQNIWLSDSFLRRQVTAVFGRLLIVNSKEVDALLYTQISSGINSTVSLANQILQFSKIECLEGKLRLYLFPKKHQRPYPHSKFMVLCSVLNSETIRNDTNIKKLVMEHVLDPYYRKWLDSQYNIS
jgi:Reverse transcriptase (RNA-dependent DNA polymerase)